MNDDGCDRLSLYVNKVRLARCSYVLVRVQIAALLVFVAAFTKRNTTVVLAHRHSQQII
jgi:hypothetical protein